ncbi:MAG: transcription antitermination factor NusB [Lachnospiraceae bacterium]|nr:transcription antitermination factor NusB [Lachnospiraceae bacterium]
MSRRQMREHIFTLLFRRDFHSKEEMQEQIPLYVESQEELNEADTEELIRKISALLEKVEELDEKISSVTEGWTTQRIGKAEITILRLALYEMMYEEDVPSKVAINEAVELAKKFGGNESPAFINGVLAKLV